MAVLVIVLTPPRGLAMFNCPEVVLYKKFAPTNDKVSQAKHADGAQTLHSCVLSQYEASRARVEPAAAPGRVVARNEAYGKSVQRHCAQRGRGEPSLESGS